MIQHAVFRGPSWESPRPPGVFRRLQPPTVQDEALSGLLAEVRACRYRVPVLYGVGSFGARVVERFVRELDANLQRPYLAVTLRAPRGSRRETRDWLFEDPLAGLQGDVSSVWFVGCMAQAETAVLPSLQDQWITPGMSFGLFYVLAGVFSPEEYEVMVDRLTLFFDKPCHRYEMKKSVDYRRAHWELLRAIHAQWRASPARGVALR